MPLVNGPMYVLPQENQQEFKLPEGKLGVLGAMLGISIVIDAAGSSFFCTAGFSHGWLHHLGTHTRGIITLMQ